MVNLTVVFRVRPEDTGHSVKRLYRRYTLRLEDVAQAMIDIWNLDGTIRAGVAWEVLRVSVTKPRLERVVDRVMEAGMRAV